MDNRIMTAAACSLLALTVAAAVKPANPFTDEMVLQRDMPVRIWGTAGAGEKVTVEFAGQKVSTVTGADGKWNLELAPMKASKENRVMTVTGSRPDESKWQNGFGMFASENVSNEIKIKDVLVGEVWMCAGQSNTDCPIWGNNPRYRDGNGSMMVQMTKKPWVRLVKTRRKASLTALDDYPVDWVPMTPEAISAMGKMPSAMGYYFALEIANALDIPVGLVDSSWGGTDVLAWAPRSGIESRQDLKDILEWRYVAMDKWTKVNRKGVVSGAHQQPSVLWNGMVAMYAPMSVRGFIWYQGCHNSGEPERYCSKMHALYNGWAHEFANPRMKLYFVQLAPWGKEIAKMQEAQAQFDAEEPNAGMAVANDVGNLFDIHPNDKYTVAKRLAVHALKRDYGFSHIVDNSPTLKSWKIEGDKFVLSFNDAESWYVYNENRSLDTGFEIAGEDGKFVKAKVGNIDNSGSIKGKDLVVFADGVKSPKKLRYLYSKPWFGSLYNQVALPLGAFHIGE